MAPSRGGKQHGWLHIAWLRIPLGSERRKVLAPALMCARGSTARFAKPIAWVLCRSVIVAVDGLRVNGYTVPLFPTNLIAPIIFINPRMLGGDEPRLARLLLHEAAHHCLVLWPEWKLWVNFVARTLLFFVPWRDRRWPVYRREQVYGVGVNSADNVAHAIMQSCAQKLEAGQ